jgi:tol-pal system protein YbgF
MQKRVAITTFQILAISFLAIFSLTNCATSEETTRLARNISATDSELSRMRYENDRRFSELAKEDENIRKQLINLSTAVDDKNEKIKIIFGKLDELEYQIRTYFDELKKEINSLKKSGTLSPGGPSITQRPATGGTSNNKDYETAYKDAFESFQKKSYEEAIKKFSAFVEAHPGTPLAPNGLYWIGESYMSVKNYEKAILSFQELVDKYPKSEKVPRALLAQADAFNAVKDKKSSITVLKKVLELFPKSEEAAIAERRLRN